MDVDQVTKKWLGGDLVLIGEYRHSKAEIINWRDKTTGRPMSAPVLRHTVEFGDGPAINSVSVSERVDESKKIEDISIPFVKGDRVVLYVEEWTRNLGLVSARGRLEKVTLSPAKGSPVGSGRSPS